MLMSLSRADSSGASACSLYFRDSCSFCHIPDACTGIMAVRGYLTVLVTQASSRTKANEVVWEDSFREGFVKGTMSFS